MNEAFLKIQPQLHKAIFSRIGIGVGLVKLATRKPGKLLFNQFSMFGLVF